MCPLHLGRFSQKLGTPLSRKDLLARLEEDEGGQTRELWEQVKEESLLELAQVIRDAIDAVDEAIPGSFCCVRSEAHFAPAIARVLAGRHPPQIRINNAIYLESGHKGFPQCVTKTFYQIAGLPPDTRVLTEADTCPHTRYSLSVKSNLAQITATLLAGCHGAKYWFPKTDPDGWQDSAPFERMLAQRRPFLQEVREIGRDVEWRGPAVMARMEELWQKPYAERAPLDAPSDDWGWRIFGRMGIAFTGSQDGNASGFPRAMSGTAPWAYGEDDLRRFLAGPLLLDGEAAWHLCAMGKAELLGVTAEPSSFPCAVEWMHVFPESARRQETATGITGGGRYRLELTSDETRVVSSYATGSQAGYEIVAPALTWFQNALGGRVAVYGLSMEAPLDWIFYNRKRKAQLLETLDWLAGRVSPAVVETDRDVLLLYGRARSDAGRRYASLFNLNPDTIERVRIALPGETVAGLERLALDGRWTPVAFAQEGASICCEADAPTMEPLLLRWSHPLGLLQSRR
jgi:hypothetical protein